MLHLKTLASEDEIFNCVGQTTKGYRCSKPINKADRSTARWLLNRLSSRSLDLESLDEDLEDLANLLLCVGYHRCNIRPNGRSNKHQVPETVAMWRSTIFESHARARTNFRAQSSHSRASKARSKTQKKPDFSERDFKQEDDEECQESVSDQDGSSDSDHENDRHDARSRARTKSSTQEDFLKREKERREEARRQSQREHAEQKEAKARAERGRTKRQREQEEANRWREQASRPSPRTQPQSTKNDDWNTSWSTYRQRWNSVAKLPRDATTADLEKVFPWPVRNIHQLGLCISRLDASFEKHVEHFFRHILSQKAPGEASDDNKTPLKALRDEMKCWHPDKLLVRFPVTAVPKALKDLATTITQVLTRLMGIFSN